MELRNHVFTLDLKAEKVPEVLISIDKEFQKVEV